MTFVELSPLASPLSREFTSNGLFRFITLPNVIIQLQGCYSAFFREGIQYKEKCEQCFKQTNERTNFFSCYRIRLANCDRLAILFRKQNHRSTWTVDSSIFPTGRWNPFRNSYFWPFFPESTWMQVEYGFGKYNFNFCFFSAFKTNRYVICVSSLYFLKSCSSCSAWNKWSRIWSFESS